MVKRLEKAILVMGLSAALLTGCASLPSPSTLVTPPQMIGNKVSAQDLIPQTQEELMQTVRSFLPQGATLVQVGIKSTADGTPIISEDLDGIEGPEIVAVYSKGHGDVGVMMLQLREGKWQKIWQPESKGYEVDYLATAEITGDGQRELLIGWRIGESAGAVLDIYSWQENELKQIGFSVTYGEVQVVDVAGLNGPDGKDEISIWQRESGDAYLVDLIEWDGKTLNPATALEPYFMTKMVDYYEERINKSPDAPLYWFYYADALERSEQWQKALDAANKGLELCEKLGNSETLTGRFRLIKERMVTKLSGS